VISGCCVLTALAGVSSRRILEALIEGERDPAVPADLAAGRARNKTVQLVAALDGTFTEHHAYMC